MDSTYQKAETHHPQSGGGPRSGRVGWIAVLVVLVLAALFGFGSQRRHRIETVAASAAQRQHDDLPVVNVIQVRRAPATSELLLPGNITPVTQAFIYARASGYVRRRLVDIGDHVKQGQLLAEIESPELDQHGHQARARLARARQEADQQQATFRSATAAVSAAESNLNAAGQNVHANQANLDRLIAMQAFENVRAPFNGIITARNFDVGALISGTSAGDTSGAGGGEMFRIGQIGPLRLLVGGPHEHAPAVRERH